MNRYEYGFANGKVLSVHGDERIVHSVYGSTESEELIKENGVTILVVKEYVYLQITPIMTRQEIYDIYATQVLNENNQRAKDNITE